VLKHYNQVAWNNKFQTWTGVWILYHHFNSLVPQVCSANQKEFAISFQGISGYISVIATLKFTYFLINWIIKKITEILRNLRLYSQYEPVPVVARSTAARLLRSWVRNPPGAWMYVCGVCCVLSSRGLCDELITHPVESYRQWRVVMCDQKPREQGGHSLRWAAEPEIIIIIRMNIRISK
jgi:hypothetical protein